MSAATPTSVTPHILDNPAWASLSGPHTAFAERAGGHAARYAPDVAPFAAIADPADPRSWDGLRSLTAADGTVTLAGILTPPDGWEVVGEIEESNSSTPPCTPSPHPRRCGSAPPTYPRSWISST